MIKEINQNPERYSKKEDRYQISATSSIKPLDLPFGEMPKEELLPVLTVDGIIIKVGEYKLISQTTLDTIRESNNPHYDIKGNGEVKGQRIGQTIPTIAVNIDNLISVSKERDVLNRVAGVTEVDYVYEGEVITDTNLSQALVEQINYTLNQDVNRPLDRYTLAELELSDESNYDITGLKIVTSQDIETNIFDFAKLTEFLKGVKERMKALNKDFNLIKDIHFKGMIPTGVANYTITKRATSEDVQEDGDFNIVYKTSELASVEKNPTQQLQEQQAAAVTELETKIAENAAIQAKSPRPPVIRLKMRKKRDLRPNTILVFENDPSAADKGARKRIIKEGDIFWGYFLKDWANGKIWAVYEPDKTTFVGYGVADKNDFVDPI